MCFGCVASTEYWDGAGEDRQLESPEDLHRKKLDLLRDRLEGRPVALDEVSPALRVATVVPSRE